MKKTLLTALAAAMAWQVNAQTYTPVTVTGFTADVIANGAGSAANSTSVDVDGVGYNFVAQNYVGPANQTPAAYLPTNGLINSAATSGLTYQLASYTGNNSLRLTGTNNGTLTFATPTTADQIYVLTTSVYTSTLTATVYFTDGSNQAFTGLTVDRWIVGTGTVALQGVGRVLRATDVLENPANAPRLYQLMLTPSTANASKLIQSIKFTKTSTGATEILHILGISVKTNAPAVATDAGITAIAAPNSGCALTNAETITATVKNNGTTALNNVPVSYKLNNGTPVNEVIPGPIAANTSLTYSFNAKVDLSALGTYNLEVRTNLAGDLAPTNDALTRSVIHSATPVAPTVTTSGSTSLCSGSSVILTAASTSTGVTYQWHLNGTAIAGATSATYTANAAGNYTAKAVIAGTCSSPASAATTLTMTTPPIAPVINITGSLAICSGDSLALTASSVPGATFSWFRNGTLIAGATNATYKARIAGSYTATASANGCNSPLSLARAVTVNARPATPTVSQVGMVLTSSSNSGNQWYKNNAAIAGQTAKTITVTSNGTYTVKATASGCASMASNAVNITTLGLNDDANNLAVAVYPNPSNGIFSIELPRGKVYEMTVTDLAGKVVKQFTATDKNFRLNLNGNAKGIYLLKIVGEGKTAMRKLVVE